MGAQHIVVSSITGERLLENFHRGKVSSSSSPFASLLHPFNIRRHNNSFPSLVMTPCYAAVWSKNHNNSSMKAEVEEGCEVPFHLFRSKVRGSVKECGSGFVLYTERKNKLRFPPTSLGFRVTESSRVARVEFLCRLNDAFTYIQIENSTNKKTLSPFLSFNRD